MNPHWQRVLRFLFHDAVNVDGPFPRRNQFAGAGAAFGRRSGRMCLVGWRWLSPGGEAMFEGLEHKKTSEEKRGLALEIVGAVIVCAVIGAAVFWFFWYFGEY